MVFVACGLNHKTAPVAMREKLALPAANHHTLLTELVGLPTINEAAILSTCNRTEIYCDTNDPQGIVPWLAEERQLAPESLAPHIYIYEGQQGIRHTLRVASGLDSMMLGEPQILGQMKQAYLNACRAGTVKQNLRPMFEYVFRASKRIRSRSGIGNNPISIAFAAVQLIGQHFSTYDQLNVLLIGSGETASLVAKYLYQHGVQQFRVAGRSRENTERLAHEFNGIALSLNDLPEHLPAADIVISATTCPLPFIDQALIRPALAQRSNKSLFLLDLAVPRDITADVGDLPGVHLYNIDDLQHRIDLGMRERQLAARQAEQLIDIELENYMRWHRSLRAKQAICAYRERMENLAEHELDRALTKLRAGQCQEDVLAELSNRLVKKLTHVPTRGLRQAATDDREELVDLAHYLFNMVDYEEIT